MAETHTFLFNGHEATVILPEHPNSEWIWKTEFLYAFDQAEKALSDEGYTRVYYSVSDRYGSPGAIRLMHAFYRYVTDKFQLKPKCHLFGFSRGGLYAFNFALFYPECVASIYLDAPVLDLKSWPLPDSPEQAQMFAEFALNKDTLPYYRENPVDNLEEFFRLQIPLLLIAGAKDELVAFPENAGKMISYCSKFKIPLQYIVKNDCGHHPHSLENVAPITAFVNANRNM